MDQLLKQNQTSIANIHSITANENGEDPFSLSASLELRRPWSPRDDSQIQLVPTSQKNPTANQLLKGTNFLKKYVVNDLEKTGQDQGAIVGVVKRSDSPKQSILKAAKQNPLRTQKSVTIADEAKNKPSSVVFDVKANQLAVPKANEVPKPKIRAVDRFKNMFFKAKVVNKLTEKSSPSKDDQIEPHLEQLKFLNKNLNPWESDEERLSRLRARHRKSLKGLTLRRKTTLQRIPSNNFAKLGSWTRMKSTILQSIKVHKFVLQPDGKLRIGWDFLGMLFILYEIIMIPMKISFNFDDTDFITALELLIDIFFLTDILLTFNTGYYSRGNLIVDRSKIAVNYLQTWFIIDLLASFPYGRILEAVDGVDDDGNTSSWVSQSARLVRVLRFFRFIRVVRLIRIFKLKSILGKLESFISLTPTLNTFLGFIRLSTIILFIAHWIACFWHLIGDFEFGDAPDTWIIRQQLQDAPWSSKYLTSIYWAVTTMITVGYGDIFPVTDTEKLYALFTMLIASVVFAYSMSSISTLLTSIDLENQEYKKTVVWVERYMRQMKLDIETRVKVKKYLEYTLNEVTYRKDDEARLLGLLSDSLKDEVVKKINKAVLIDCEPLERLLKKTFSERFITEMIYFFQEQIYSPGEVVFEENDSEGSIYMVTMGSVQITLFRCSELVIDTISKGGHFGEVEFFTGSNRRYGARAGQEFLSLFYLKRKDLLDLIDNFQNEKERFFQLKDKVTLYQDYTGIDYKCTMCKRGFHSPLHCPATHYVVDKEKLLQEQIKEMYKFRQSFVRRNRTKWKHNNMDRDLEDVALRIRENYSNFIEAAENEAENRKFDIHSFGDETPSLTRRFNDHSAHSSPGKPAKSAFRSIVESLDGQDFSIRESNVQRFSRIKNQVKKLNKTNNFEVGFDMVYSFMDYFPHNNVEKVIEKANEKLRMARRMKRMRAIRRVIAFTGMRKKTMTQTKKPQTPAASHDYGVGKIKFLSANSKYEEELIESMEPEMTSLRQGHADLQDDFEMNLDNIPEEEVKFNKRYNQENREFNNKIEAKFLQTVQAPTINAIQVEALDQEEFGHPGIRINLADSDSSEKTQDVIRELDTGTKTNHTTDYNMVTEVEINKLLHHVIEKYGPNYVREIINKKAKE